MNVTCGRMSDCPTRHKNGLVLEVHGISEVMFTLTFMCAKQRSATGLSYQR